MTIKVPVQQWQVEVQFVLHAVRVTTDRELIALLRDDAKKSTAELVAAIKARYRDEFGSAFTVSDRSMSVEIWGHVYADQLAKWIQKFSRVGLINKITGKIIYHAQLIDIGERGHDNNRIVWDCLAPFLSIIAFFLP